MLRHVARFIRSEIHLPDILFRYRSDEFIALLHSKEARATEALGRKDYGDDSRQPFGAAKRSEDRDRGCRFVR